MNKKMLRTLVDLCGNEIGAVTIEIFKEHYPPSPKTASDVRTLRNLGYISFEYADDEISDIVVKNKAVDYFK